jgi:enoyl-[acyl-carrier protein] reductase III
VVLAYHSDEDAALATAEAVERVGGRARLVKADAGTPEGCAAMIDAVRALTDRLDQVVHCAVDAYASPALAADPVRFARAVTTNGTSLLFLVQASLPLLSRGRYGFLFDQPGRADRRAKLRRRWRR